MNKKFKIKDVPLSVPDKPKRKIKTELTASFTKATIQKVRHYPGWPVEDTDFELVVDPITDGGKIFAMNFKDPDQPKLEFEFIGKRSGYLTRYLRCMFTKSPMLRLISREDKNNMRVAMTHFIDYGIGYFQFRWSYNTHEWTTEYKYKNSDQSQKGMLRKEVDRG
jgi:hypothetical protein